MIKYFKKISPTVRWSILIGSILALFFIYVNFLYYNPNALREFTSESNIIVITEEMHYGFTINIEHKLLNSAITSILAESSFKSRQPYCYAQSGKILINDGIIEINYLIDELEETSFFWRKNTDFKSDEFYQLYLQLMESCLQHRIHFKKSKFYINSSEGVPVTIDLKNHGKIEIFVRD